MSKDRGLIAERSGFAKLWCEVYRCGELDTMQRERGGRCSNPLTRRPIARITNAN